MSSGVGVHPDCVKAFTDIKLGHKYRYIVYAISKDLKEIQVHSTAPPTSTYDNFVQELLTAAQDKQCRYGVFDAEYILGSGQKRSKLVFFVWNPDTSPVKQKMVYSSSKDALKKAINFVAKDFQANDQEDLAWSNLLESLIRLEASGVAVHEDCMKAHEEIKQHKMWRYVIFAIGEGYTEICPIKKGEPSCTYEDFVEELTSAEKEGQSRYGIYDLHFTLANGQERKRLCMVFWNPDTAPVKQKMLYSSSKDAFKKKIQFTAKDYQANDQDDLRYDNFLEFMKKHEVSQ